MRNQGGDIMEEASWELSRGLAGRAGGSVKAWLARVGLEPESVKKRSVLLRLNATGAPPLRGWVLILLRYWYDIFMNSTIS